MSIIYKLMLCVLTCEESMCADGTHINVMYRVVPAHDSGYTATILMHIHNAKAFESINRDFVKA